jgi:flagellar hook-associated protein 3 FlgL
MRVTSNTFPSSLLDQLSQLSVKQNRIQNQAATGQRVQLPEDDPVAMRRILDMKSESKTLGQYQRNIARHQELATASFSAMTALKKISDRAGEIATLADGTKSPEELTVYSKEVTELIKQAVQITNVKNRGDYIFGGTITTTPPFALATAADGSVSSVAYQGNTSQAESEISEGVTMTTQILGANTTGSGPRGLITDSATGADFFNHLISLQDNLKTANTAAVASTDRSRLATDESNILYQIGGSAALQARLESVDSGASLRGTSIGKLISKEADADLPQTVVKLQQIQYSYQAALQAGANILNRSLLDYLH